MSKKPKGGDGVGLSAFRPSNSVRSKARAAEMMADKRMVRINFDLDMETHRRLRVASAHTGQTVAALLRRAIEVLVDGDHT